jgi:hypothetical protein
MPDRIFIKKDFWKSITDKVFKEFNFFYWFY